VTDGISPTKVEASGWGEYRPMVANSANGNTLQNRRVEIFLRRPKAVEGAAFEAPAATTPLSTPKKTKHEAPQAEEIVK
jgi:hypothetical protein